MREENIWRECTSSEAELLKTCEAADFTIFESPNAGDFWVTCDRAETELTTGWFETEEEAQEWLEGKHYLDVDTKWLKEDVDL